MNTSSNKIILTGGDGQLASAIRHLQHPAFNILPFSHSAFDITHAKQVDEVFSTLKPQIVINTAAYTAVDKAETEPEKALAINAKAMQHLAQACEQRDILLIHLSTDYVFDGLQSIAYLEEDQANPLNIYGQSKLLGEQLIQQRCKKHIILRVSGVFSEYGNNFLKTITRLLQEKETLHIVNDQITCPTYAGDIANAICKILISPKKHGIYHYCSKQTLSWYDFTKLIAAEMQSQQSIKVKKILPIASTDYQAAAIRPAYSVLNCHKILMDYGITQPCLQTAIKKILNHAILST